MLADMSDRPKTPRFQFGLWAIFWALALAGPAIAITRVPRPFGNWTFVVLTAYCWCIMAWIVVRQRKRNQFPKI